MPWRTGVGAGRGVGAGGGGAGRGAGSPCFAGSVAVPGVTSWHPRLCARLGRVACREDRARRPPASVVLGMRGAVPSPPTA